MARDPDKKYWVFVNGKAWGPYPPHQLASLKGFGPQSLVAPLGAASSADWKKAESIAELSPLFKGSQTPDIPPQ